MVMRAFENSLEWVVGLLIFGTVIQLPWPVWVRLLVACVLVLLVAVLGVAHDEAIRRGAR